EMKKEPYLEIVTTSGFQMNPMTGSFGGEIRLGYYFDGEKTVPVTGGSITVNMNKVLGNMYMSKETKQYDNIVLPKTVQLFNVAVAGEE
ncbi:MAG: TldD/PmbA family protein, partial [Erysipelotrichaceae bacterium]|nr:TldD/PmbA family protein [Erysipelotrichaceae bacterium]